MSKKINPIKKDHGLAKSENVLDWIDNTRLVNYFPERDSWRQRLKYTMFEWVETADALTEIDFCIHQRINRATFRRWIDAHQDLKEAWEQVKLIMANKKIRGALKKEYDKEVVFKDLYKYDSEWDEIDKRNAALRKSETPDAQPTVIQLPAAPDTGIQPMHLRKEEHAASKD